MENIDFVNIYREYRTKVIDIAETVLHDRNEAEDVCQDVFEILYNMGETADFSDDVKLNKLITRMSFNKALDYYKRAFRKYEYVDSDELMAVAELKVQSGGNVENIHHGREGEFHVERRVQS